MAQSTSGDADPRAVDALRLMRKALILLDRAGANAAAIYLQHAIDTLDSPSCTKLEK